MAGSLRGSVPSLARGRGSDFPRSRLWTGNGLEENANGRQEEKTMRRRAWAVALVMAVGLAGAVEATQTLFTDFEGFKTGASINGQNGWARTGPYDEQVVNAGRDTAWRGSNTTASRSLGATPFYPRFGALPAQTVINTTNR